MAPMIAPSLPGGTAPISRSRKLKTERYGAGSERRRDFRLLPRVHQAADEEDDSGARVADQEDERVIGAEDNGLFLRSAEMFLK
jgi:hypothetical protein